MASPVRPRCPRSHKKCPQFLGKTKSWISPWSLWQPWQSKSSQWWKLFDNTLTTLCSAFPNWSRFFDKSWEGLDLSSEFWQHQTMGMEGPREVALAIDSLHSSDMCGADNACFSSCCRNIHPTQDVRIQHGCSLQKRTLIKPNLAEILHFIYAKEITWWVFINVLRYSYKLSPQRESQFAVMWHNCHRKPS